MHWVDWAIMLVPLLMVLGMAFYSGRYVRMRPASPMVRRKRDFFEWEFTKKMNAVGL